jgi:hypothetical protein
MILLLTGCINPNGMTMTALSNQEERKKQYVEAIHFYLSNTRYPIVFSENSGTDISHLFKKEIQSGRLEYLSFSGNQNKEKGKGYGECEIIQYALNNSKIIHFVKDKRIAKITGRLIIRNINSIVRGHSILFPQKTVFCAINSNLSFPDSRFIIAPECFYQTFLKSKEAINDTQGYFFEHTLCDTIKREKQLPYSRFLLMPQIEGMSGSSGEIYQKERITISFAIKYFKYTYSQRCSFYRQYR